MNIFIVVSAYNEEERIGAVLGELTKTDYPVIVVDDGSTDNTYKLASKFNNQQSTINNLWVLRHKVNLGKGAAMKTGAEAAFLLGAQAVIFMDGDGQHSVSDINKFNQKLMKYDAVFGERIISKDTSLRIYGSRFISSLTKILFDIDISDQLCGYRALTKKAYENIKWNTAGYGVEMEMVARAGKKKIKYGKVLVKSIYHDTYKGFTVIDGLKLIYNIFVWKLTL